MSVFTADLHLLYLQSIFLRPSRTATEFKSVLPVTSYSPFVSHVDGGGVERWEDKAYNHVYRKIFQGKVRRKVSGGFWLQLIPHAVARVRPL
jgi:hypothetical protein